jgi:hypothetical protein
MKCAGSLGFDAITKLMGAIRSEFGLHDGNKKTARSEDLAAFCKASDGFLRKLIAV